MYIWFSQYMLIWYANLPEETVYFIPRMRGAWLPLVMVEHRAELGRAVPGDHEPARSSATRARS